MYHRTPTMRLFILLAATFIAGAAAVQVLPSGIQGYHESVGIPEARRIKELEDNILRNETNTRIVGGIVTQPFENPHLAGMIINLVNTAGLSACGSSLLTPLRLVTAAHCWFDGTNQAWQFTVVLGSQFLFTGGLRIATSQVFMHPQWIPELIANDVAMISLPQWVTYTSSIQPISLPSGNELFETYVGDWGIAAGYGKTSDQQVGISVSAVVSQAHMQVITVAQCQATYGFYARDTNVCTNGAGGVGICGGDSGGPLTAVRNGRRILIGISSFTALAGCQLGHPSAFARVSSFMSFISQYL